MDEKEINMVENEDGEYVAEVNKKQNLKSEPKINMKKHIPLKLRKNKSNVEEQFMEGFETGLRIVKKVNEYLKELE